MSKFVGKFNRDFLENFDDYEDSEDIYEQKRLRHADRRRSKINKNEDLIKSLRQEDMQYGEK